ncbi:MAG: TlpA family protein disulfide reductase [Vicinamibacteria bacterium]
MNFARLLPLLAVALSAGPARSAFASSQEAWVPQERREAAPKLSLRDVEGRKRQLTQLNGKVVVVNFWATWCGPCTREMPEFTKLYAAYQDRGVELIGAANEPRASRDKVREFARSLEIAFPIWLEASLDHMEAFGVGPELPATVIVDSEGRIAARIQGATDEARLRALVDRILLEATPSSAPAGSR